MSEKAVGLSLDLSVSPSVARNKVLCTILSYKTKSQNDLVPKRQ